MAGEAVEVGQFVAFARSALVNEPYLSNAAIIGELTKFTLARSGHTYFTLTDNQGSLTVFYLAETILSFPKESRKARNLSRLEESTSM